GFLVEIDRGILRERDTIRFCRVIVHRRPVNSIKSGAACVSAIEIICKRQNRKSLLESCLLMLFKTQSAAVYGIDANIIEVEVDIGTRQLEKENFQTVGLP